MPTASSEPVTATRPSAPPGRLAALLAVLVVLCGTLAGCRLLPGDDAEPAAVEPRADATVEQLRTVLAARARAVRRGDRAAYAATLAPARAAPPGARRRAQRLFANLQDLPVARFGHVLDPTTVVRSSDGSVVAEVTTVLRLEGFDAVPVRTPGLFRFAPVARRGGPGGVAGYRVASDRDVGWARERGIAPQPWQLARLVVRRGAGTLVLTDRQGADVADRLVEEVERAAADVAPVVPYPWDRSVVVYALSDTRLLEGLREVPGGDPEDLDGVSVPVRARATRGRLASTRVVLHPRMLERPSRARERLLRHELVHVALAARDDHVPTWLAEGIAEWVAVQAMPVPERTIARSAVAAAREGVDVLPDDATFNGPASGANYGVAWWAVEHVVAAYSEATLWHLFEVLRTAEPGTEDEQLRRVLGIDGHQLASEAGTRIVTTFS